MKSFKRFKIKVMTIVELKLGLIVVLQLLSCNQQHTETNQATDTIITTDLNEGKIHIDSAVADVDEEVRELTVSEKSEAPKLTNKVDAKETESDQTEVVVNEEVVEEVENIVKTSTNTEEVAEDDIDDNLMKQDLHVGWDNLMKKYVSGSGAVDYAGLKKEAQKVNDYLKKLSLNSPAANWNDAEKLSFLINAYNAATVSLILDNYPVKSITDLHNGKPWDYAFIKIGAKTYTLNDIEHKIIRPRFKEPRIHFAVNCAAISCPKLLNEAYLPSKLESQLDKQTKLFINNKQKNQITANQLKLSKIFDWYKEDFGNLQAFIKPFVQSSIEANASISYLEYDWGLNKK